MKAQRKKKREKIKAVKTELVDVVVEKKKEKERRNK